MSTKRKFSDDIRAAVVNSGRTGRSIAKEAGIDPAALCRFVHGQMGLQLENIDKLAECIGLRAVVEPKRRKDR